MSNAYNMMLIKQLIIHIGNWWWFPVLKSHSKTHDVHM